MYIVFIIDHIHHLMNEFKILTFAYTSDLGVYILPSKSMQYHINNNNQNQTKKLKWIKKN